MKKLSAITTITTITVIALATLATPASAQDATSIASLSWMNGGWVQKSGGAEIEERWIGPKGDLLAGVNITVARGRTSFEYLRIAKTPKGIAYIAQPGGKTPVEFPLKEMSEKKVVFENLAHDFPQRILYELRADGTLHARVEGMLKGKLEGEDFTFAKSVP